MTPDQPDELLVERAKRGDTRAFEMLVVKYQRRIERLIARMVRDVDLVQDIAQESLSTPGSTASPSTRRRKRWST
jgi:RNA polymerase sigma-70 factor (ECF subfamily)